ncbi:Chaperone protein dnaj protein [Thalictrum thalictroides]|uniref:Chaperone protein dnaj protein n=1 Tax=Thalictrum thalictroides TaxID=46969 RepID=A0A7J6WRI8_THATH|nr:Chaperone protein dnaj protein [Thalictrum thalictroides]
MGRFNGSNLVCLLTRRYLASHLQNHNFGSVKQRNWVSSGDLHGSLGVIRFIHVVQYSHYALLKFGDNATRSEINSVYYEHAKKLHSEMNKDDPDDIRKFQHAEQACEVLKENRAESEQHVTRGHRHPGEFDEFRKVVRLRQEVSKKKDETAVPCEACGGTGLPPGTKPETCTRCNGVGLVCWQESSAHSVVFETSEYTCTKLCIDCFGCGEIVTEFCKSCKGDGVAVKL